MSSNDTQSKKGHLKPFLKWAGGKRWFVNNYSNLLPKRYNIYIEPFLGSGAVFFFLCPERAFLGDSNRDLINTYIAVKNDWPLVYRYLREHHRNHSYDYYYKVREFYPRSLSSCAARFIYLNRTCWNGLYRVNRNGFFNVPIGTKATVIHDDDDFEGVSEALQVADLYPYDFEDLIDSASKDDFVFVDPPYTVRHNNNAFIKYNEKLFSWSDQERLFFALKSAKERGAQIVGTNACNEGLRELYEGTFNTRVVSRYSSISSDVKNRKSFEELVFYTEVASE